MKFIVLILSLMLGTQSFAGTELQDGGGGVQKQGRYMTFFSAKIPIAPVPEQASAIPGMNFLIQQLSTLPVLGEAKTALLKATFPSSARPYYKVPAESLNSDNRKAILAEYAKVLNCSTEDLVLFAATDPVTKTTVLFPEFYQLKEAEQAAILFHEVLWTLDKRFTYLDVMTLEANAQAYFEKPFDQNTFYNFFNGLSAFIPQGKRNLFVAVIAFDKANPANVLFSTNLGRPTLQDVFGDDWFQCVLWNNLNCGDNLLAALIQKSQQDPLSLFRRALVEYKMTDPFATVMGSGITGYFNNYSNDQSGVGYLLRQGFFLDIKNAKISADSNIEIPVLLGPTATAIGKIVLVITR